jgi:mitogen-activated protein kinase kinase
MEREGSLHGLEAFDKLTLERARTMDVEDLDDEGWRIASLEGRIIELGNLGEGAGGAVTRCKLKGGNTVFALKVRYPSRGNKHDRQNPPQLTHLITRSSRQIPIPMLRSRS